MLPLLEVSVVAPLAAMVLGLDWIMLPTELILSVPVVLMLPRVTLPLA